MLKQVQHDGEATPRYAGGMISSLLLFLAAATPQPTALKTFQDWTVGCDNGRACHAVALVPDHWPDDALTMSVRRGAEAGAQPVVAFELGADSNAAAVSADGRRLAIRLIGAGGETRVAPADSAAAIAALRSAGQLRLLGADGKPLGSVSLKGASAALLYMDEQQRRVGTATALVRPGSKAASVPPPPPLPVVAARPQSPRPPLAISASTLSALRRKHGCTLDEVGGPEEHEIAAIGPSETLLLLACGSGAYNISHVPFVIRRGRGGAQLAAFDISPEYWDDGKPVLVNATWDKARGLLTAYSKGRGLGDCGTSTEFAWDGSRFRLVEQSEMDECRGSTDYITTWRAKVVRR
jgi:hypothetical protein